MASESYAVTRTYPDYERYGLGGQMNRSAVSVAANIAEGAGRKSKREFINFLSISNGSSYEFDTHLIISKNVGYLDEETYERLNSLNNEIQRMLSRLIDTLDS